MRQLLLLRHAKSSWDDPRLPDRERPLSARGRAAAAIVGRAMNELGLTPDLVLVSTSQRTMETLAAFDPWDDSPLIEAVEALYLAPAAELIRVLRGIAETVRSVLLIGHNPGLHDLALTLIGAHALVKPTPDGRRIVQGFPTAALAEFAITGAWWQLGEGGGRLVRFICPRDLAESMPAR
jgi:phosphohistidine phosphatase